MTNILGLIGLGWVGIFMDNKKPNQSKIEKRLKHYRKDVENFDQVLIIDSLGKHMDQIQKATRWGLAIVLILIGSAFVNNLSLKIFGLDISIDKIIYFAHASFIFVNVSLIVWFIRIEKLILFLDGRENFIKGLSMLSTHTLFFNPFSFLGSNKDSQRGMKINFCMSFLLLLSLLVLAAITGKEKPFLMVFSCTVVCFGLFVIKGIIDIINFRLVANNE